MKSWERRSSLPNDKLINNLENLPMLSQYSCVVLRLAMDKTDEAKKLIFCRADYWCKKDAKPEPSVLDYDNILLIQSILEIDEFIEILSDLINEGKGKLDSFEFNAEFQDSWDLEINHSSSNHAQIKSEYPFYYYSNKLNHNKNYDSYLPVTGKDMPPYPNVSTAIIDNLDLYSQNKRAEWINDSQFMISAPDFRAGIKKLKIEKNKISIQIISKFLKDGEMYAQFYTDDKQEGHVPVKNGSAEANVTNNDKILAIIKEKSSHEMLDYFDYTVRWGGTEDSVEKVIPEEIVKTWIDGGENETVEFKEVLNHADDVVKSIVAFANTNGGVILVGVKDDGSIVGYKESSDSTRERVERMIAEKCDPPVPFGIERVNVGEEITVIKISKGDKKIYAVNNGGIYVRRNSSDRFIKPSELEERFSKETVHY